MNIDHSLLHNNVCVHVDIYKLSDFRDSKSCVLSLERYEQVKYFHYVVYVLCCTWFVPFVFCNLSHWKKRNAFSFSESTLGHRVWDKKELHLCHWHALSKLFFMSRPVITFTGLDKQTLAMNFCSVVNKSTFKSATNGL